MKFRNDIEQDINEGKVPFKLSHIIPNPDDLEELPIELEDENDFQFEDNDSLNPSSTDKSSIVG